MKSNERFEKFIAKYGFKIRKIPYRSDILSVQFKNLHIMTIPAQMYAFEIKGHNDNSGNQHPDYFDREHYSVAWNKRLRDTNYFEEAFTSQLYYDAIKRKKEADNQKIEAKKTRDEAKKRRSRT